MGDVKEISEEREKRVDLSTWDEERRNALLKGMSEKITSSVGKVVLDVNKMLNVYGLHMHMVYSISTLDTKPDTIKNQEIVVKPEELQPVKTKRGRKKKAETIIIPTENPKKRSKKTIL